MFLLWVWLCCLVRMIVLISCGVRLYLCVVVDMILVCDGGLFG